MQDSLRPEKVNPDCGFGHLSQSDIAVSLDRQHETEAGWEVRSMKVSLILAVSFLSGCGAVQSLEQLEEQALVTGNWSAVEARERSIQRRIESAPIQGPSGYYGLCELTAAAKRCACLSGRSFNSMMVTY